MATIVTIDSQNREVNSLYRVMASMAKKRRTFRDFFPEISMVNISASKRVGYWKTMQRFEEMGYLIILKQLDYF